MGNRPHIPDPRSPGFDITGDVLGGFEPSVLQPLHCGLEKLFLLLSYLLMLVVEIEGEFAGLR